MFTFIGHEMDATGELVDGRAFAAQVEDADLRIGHTATETRFRVRLVFDVAIATCWTTTHREILKI